MKTEEFTGRSGEMRDSPWLAAEDLMGLGDVQVTIDKVWHHEDIVFAGGQREKEKYSLSFVGKQRRMLLNSSNRNALTHKFGADSSQWKGKTITLRVLQVRGVGGKLVPGIRVVVGDTPPADAPRRIELPPREEEAKPAAECKGCGASVPVALMNEGLCPECDADPKIPF